MNEDALLLLGMLRAQSQHGYQINEFIERNLSRVAVMKKATAYAVLERLCKSGFVSVHNEQEGNRPPRKVYSITPQGEEEFIRLLRLNLSSAHRLVLSGDIALMFVDSLTKDEVVELLSQRLSELEAQLAMYEAAPKHGAGLGVDLSLEHHLVMLKTDREWLSSVIRRISAIPLSEWLYTEHKN
ncbi:MAG TPA: PadR family transcriptional regulator [Chloroflexia bacterium]|nr:PadR family transcriptional regulator [Chloroflexia bacterium]